VNSISDPKTNWDERERPPDSLTVLLKAAGTPIDHYSYEAVELLKDTSARWSSLRKIRDSAAMKTNTDPAIAALMKVPNAEIYTIDVSFQQIKNAEERFYLNQQPTSFVLADEAVDRLRRAAGAVILESPEFQRLIKDVGVTIKSKR
jgi:NTE family protein